MGGANRYTCTECGKVLTSARNLETHEMIHTGEKPFVCLWQISEGPQGRCYKSFHTYGSLKLHERLTHKEEKRFACSTCGRAMNSKIDLERHERTHTGEKPFACPKCDKVFSTKVAVRQHDRSHTGERPYSCSKCDKKFHTRSNLGKHLIIHTGEKPFACSKCEKAFNTASYLKVHERTHTGEKPFVCAKCGKTFLTISNLKTHARTHTGEKPSKLAPIVTKHWLSVTVQSRHVGPFQFGHNLAKPWGQLFWCIVLPYQNSNIILFCMALKCLSPFWLKMMKHVNKSRMADFLTDNLFVSWVFQANCCF